MRFIIVVLTFFFAGAALLAHGFREDAVTTLVGLACCVAAEIHKPEKGTIVALSWARANLKWICLPLTLPTLWS